MLKKEKPNILVHSPEKGNNGKSFFRRLFTFRKKKEETTQAKAETKPKEVESRQMPTEVISEGLMQEKKGGFWHDVFLGLKSIPHYAANPRAFIEDVKAITKAVSGKNLATSAGIFVFAHLASEAVAIAAKNFFGVWLGKKYGQDGVVAGTALGGMLPAILTMQILLPLSIGALYMKKLGLTVEEGLAKVWQAQPKTLKVIVRGLPVGLATNVIVGVAGKAIAFAFGSAAAVSFINIQEVFSFTLFVSLMMVVNKDLIAEVAGDIK